jgi:hypothetical protein
VNLHRFLTAAQFANELKPLQAFPHEYVGLHLLEELESARLLIPRLRVRFPDPIARRWWLEHHDTRPFQMAGALESDGPRWDAANAMRNAFFRWQHARAYGASPHPLDNPTHEFAQFIQNPILLPFEPWLEMRTDVSNDLYTTLYDDTYVTSYYSSWQLLLAAEEASAGIRFRINLADDEIKRAAYAALESGRAPGDRYSVSFAPIRAVRSFEEHQRTLDATVWYAEECDRALGVILANRRGGRFVLTDAEAEAAHQSDRDIGKSALIRFSIAAPDLISTARFLGSRWSEWEDHGRPLVARAYKATMGKVVELLMHSDDISFSEARDLVGSVDGYKPLVEAVWPSWIEGEKDRVRRALKSAFSEHGEAALTESEVNQFVEFLANNGLEAFFWRLRSFEEHAFRGTGPVLQAMRADVQGMAVVVEHVAGALGGTETQLYEKFKQIWTREPNVLALLRLGRVSPLARTERLAHNWLDLKRRLEALRAEPHGAAVADLVWAARIRGGVHNALPEDGHFELEGQFLTLMRAAALTFAQAQRGLQYSGGHV